MGNWRSTVVEKDYSGFVALDTNEVGAMVVESQKGTKKPIKLQSEKDVLTYLGKPSATYKSVFEAISFTKSAPLWVSCAYATDALYGGVDVLASSVVSFGVGRDYDTFAYGTSAARVGSQSGGNGDGVVAQFTGTLSNTPIVNPITSFTIKINGVVTDAVSDGSGTITGTDISAGTINLTSGAFDITFSGTIGEYATLTSDIDLSSNVDLSTAATDKIVNITIDDVSYDVNFGQGAATTQASIVSAINVAFGSTVAATSTNFVKITGEKGSTLGNVTLSAPSTGASGLGLIFITANITTTDVGVNPIGAIPGYNEAILIAYNYSVDSTAISHSFFTTSPYADDLAMYVISQGGSKFKAYLYQKTDSGAYAKILDYDYSLIREKNAFGASLYYEDVFLENPYIKVMVNASYIGTAYNISSTTQIVFSGGSRGGTVLNSDYLSSWAYFQKASKYEAKIFMDVVGNSATTLNSLIQTYQPWAQGITITPYGTTTANALTYRSSLGVDSDDIGLYHNWVKIQDDYNNSFAWISSVGSIGRKFALCETSYDAASPAGIDENSYGGQISDWRVIDIENDYEGDETETLDAAQINPLVFDDTYGLLLEGDRTLQVTNSDTSFVGTRRVYKNIIEMIKRQVMRRQQFKNNDPRHRISARIKTDNIIIPVFAGGWIREYQVICDSSNNGDDVLNRREFVIDVYIKITPNSQTVRLNFVRLSQSQTVASII